LCTLTAVPEVSHNNLHRRFIFFLCQAYKIFGFLLGNPKLQLESPCALFLTARCKVSRSFHNLLKGAHNDRHNGERLARLQIYNES
jgi:hypothetical protein